MANICLYFQVHQPFRLRPYTVFDTASDYFDTPANREIVQRVAEKCYRPANRLILSLLRRYRGRFRVAYSITGTAVEQLADAAPDVLASFRELAGTGAVEFLAETYHHSLASFFSPGEFAVQVAAHRAMVWRFFRQRPRTFRNTELIYSNDIAGAVESLGFRTMLTEGWEDVLGARAAGWVYEAALRSFSAETAEIAERRGEIPPPPHGSANCADPWHPGLPPTAAAFRSPPPRTLKRELRTALRVLLRHYRLSDDITFRFARRDWAEWPVTAETFAQRIAQCAAGPLCNLFMDYETLGEHQSAETGIFEFLRHLPARALAAGHCFVTPAEAVALPEAQANPAVLNVPRAISWADVQRDVSAWLGNAMQMHAAEAVYGLEAAVKRGGDRRLLADWRRLTTSDHLHYMSTKGQEDAGVHSYFSPYGSPYEAYINFMNVVENLRRRSFATT